MKTKIQIFSALLLLLTISLTSCNSSGNGFSLSGNLEGLTDGTIYLTYSSGSLKTDTVLVKEGKFEYSNPNLTEPLAYSLRIEGKERSYLRFYADNAKMTLTAHADSLSKAVISGGKTQELDYELAERTRALQDKHQVNQLRGELYGRNGAKPTPEREAEINALLDKFTQEYEQLKLDFVKENPKEFYSAVTIKQMSSGKGAEEIEKYLSMLDKSLESTSIVTDLRKKLDEMKKTEVSLDKFIPDAHNLVYRVDDTYKGKQHTEIVYLATLTDNSVCALQSSGNVIIIDQSGKAVKTVNTGLKSKPSAIATDETDNIYVFGAITQPKTIESRGRTSQILDYVGVECFVFSPKGKKLREVKLEGVVTATGARVSNNHILVADTRGRHIVIYDAQTGEKKSSIENLRTCCGILDFSIRNNNEILVANLGAFRVDSFDYNGKALFSFGQRGTSLDEFHGCCNPVSVGFLSNGGIVSVEKDPTRIKVYSAEGAKKIEGIDELVKGCSHIPVIVDKNDNIYLASKNEGLIKCSPVKQ